MGMERLEEGTPAPGERRVSEDQRELEGFDRRRSAGLFVGIGTYQDENLASIPFAVDDAVDLAHLFLVELQLIHESHTVLCLAGRPRKEETAEKLRRLEGQGVEIRRPLQTEIYTLLERLGGRTNSKGLFLVAVASHGVSFEGADYLLAEDSQRRRAARTGIAVAELFDEVAQARAPRQIVLLDACRERLTGNLRAGAAEAAAAMSPTLEQAIGRARGQAILLGTTLGGYSYDDLAAKNGVFSSSLLEGLRGEAPGDDRDYITIRTLGEYVDERVREWVLRHRPEHAEVSRGITVHVEGAAAALPLALARQDPMDLPIHRLGPYARVKDLLEMEDLDGEDSLGLRLARLPAHSLARLDELLSGYRLRQEMRVARELRLTLGAAKTPDLDGYELRFRQETVPWSGGDFFGFEVLDGGRCLVYLGEVTGRGLGAMVGVSLLRNSLESLVRRGSGPVSEQIEELNRILKRDAPEARFFSLFAAILDSQNHRLEYVNAGHPAGFLLKREGLYELPSTAPILGIIDGISPQSTVLSLAPEDRLVLYTDGVMELENSSGEEFGLDRLRETLLAYPPGDSGDAFLDRLLADLESFSAGKPPADDQTVLTLKRLTA